MIIAHFFLREVRKKPYLYVETTSSIGLEQPSPAARRLIEVSYKDRRQEWIRNGYYAFSDLFPNLVLVDAMENTLRLESDHPSFDLVFRPLSHNSAPVTNYELNLSKITGIKDSKKNRKSDDIITSVICHLFNPNVGKSK